MNVGALTVHHLPRPYFGSFTILNIVIHNDQTLGYHRLSTATALGTNQPGGLPFYFHAVRRGREGALGVRRERMGILGWRARRAPPQNPLVLTYPQQRSQQKQVSPFLLTGNAQSANEGSALLALRLSTQFLSTPISRCGGGRQLNPRASNTGFFRFLPARPVRSRKQRVLGRFIPSLGQRNWRGA